MDRRNFLKLLLATAAITLAEPQLDKILEYTSHLPDKEFINYDFVTYIKFAMNLYVNNPKQCGIITGITDSD